MIEVILTDAGHGVLRDFAPYKKGLQLAVTNGRRWTIDNEALALIDNPPVRADRWTWPDSPLWPSSCTIWKIILWRLPCFDRGRGVLARGPYNEHGREQLGRRVTPVL
jgi:hypothetical protein